MPSFFLFIFRKSDAPGAIGFEYRNADEMQLVQGFKFRVKGGGGEDE
jgi:hypothetical protein